MKNIPQISDTEWEIMKVLWAKSPVNANEIVEALADKVTWKPKTVKTLIGRLVKKKAVAFEKYERAYLYYPLVSENECVNAESQTFLKRVYNGAANLMLANFIEREELSRDEIEELKKILDKKDS